MKVILAATISGTRDGKEWPPIGSEVDLPEFEAKSMVVGGTAYLPGSDAAERLAGRLSLVEIAGAPEGRDWTAGQPETNLARGQAIRTSELDEDAETLDPRDAAVRTGMTDEIAGPRAFGADVTGGETYVVGDGSENPLHTQAAALRNAGDDAPLPPADTEKENGVDVPESLDQRVAAIEAGVADADRDTQRAVVADAPSRDAKPTAPVPAKATAVGKPAATPAGTGKVDGKTDSK